MKTITKKLDVYLIFLSIKYLCISHIHIYLHEIRDFLTLYINRSICLKVRPHFKCQEEHKNSRVHVDWKKKGFLEGGEGRCQAALLCFFFSLLPSSEGKVKKWFGLEKKNGARTFVCYWIQQCRIYNCVKWLETTIAKLCLHIPLIKLLKEAPQQRSHFLGLWFACYILSPLFDYFSVLDNF